MNLPLFLQLSVASWFLNLILRVVAKIVALCYINGALRGKFLVRYWQPFCKYFLSIEHFSAVLLEGGYSPARSNLSSTPLKNLYAKKIKLC
jgi:hypothetical protein